MFAAVAAYKAAGGTSGPPEVRLQDIDIGRLLAGDKREWDAFVAAAAPLIHAMIRRVFVAHGEIVPADLLDAAQDVFVRLSADGFGLLRRFDPARSSLVTWLALIARSAAHDSLRRRRQATVPLDDLPETAVAVEDRHAETWRIPAGVLTERQALVLRLIYDRDMDVADIARLLQVDAQTIRSTHHKAISRLREHLGVRPGDRG